MVRERLKHLFFPIETETLGTEEEEKLPLPLKPEGTMQPKIETTFVGPVTRAVVGKSTTKLEIKTKRVPFIAKVDYSPQVQRQV
jgi:hypothetical protein